MKGEIFWKNLNKFYNMFYYIDKHIRGTVDVLGLAADPENHDTTAGTGGSYPIMKSYSFGINVTF